MSGTSSDIVIDTGDVGIAMDGLPACGDVLAGRYRIERLLGSGGMGVVAAAIHEVLHQRVAIKFLYPSATDDGSTLRFIQEARAAATIHSEHAVGVMDVGALDNGVPYMVLEYLEGNDLAEEVAARGAIPVAQAVDWILQAGEALAEAHSIGIVHRDLKPSNLFLANKPDGSRILKVLDFGIAKKLGPDAILLTGTAASGKLLGTAAYMPPEQIRSPKTVDPRADLWALGVTLWELITGRRLFSGDSMGEILAAVLEQEAPPLRMMLPDAPAGLERVLAKCLARSRDDRYSTIAEFAAALAPFGSDAAPRSLDSIRGVLRVPEAEDGQAPAGPAIEHAGGNLSTAQTLAAGSPTGLAESPPPQKHSRLLWIGAAGIAMAGIAAAGWWVQRAQDIPTVAEPSSTAALVRSTTIAVQEPAPAETSAPDAAPVASASAPPIPASTSAAGPKTASPAKSARPLRPPVAPAKDPILGDRE